LSSPPCKNKFHASFFADVHKALHSPAFVAQHRVSDTDFTRNRTLTFPVMVAALAQGLVKGLQTELDDFFGKLAGQASFMRQASKSAFSQARRKLKPAVFASLNHMLLDAWYRHVDPPRWRGLRLVAADTTTLRLPKLPEVAEQYGCHGDRWGGEAPMAQAIGLFDVTSRLMLHAQLAPAASRERALLADCLHHVQGDDLLLLDRGFPAYWLFAWLLEQGKSFCMRVDGVMSREMEDFAYRSKASETVLDFVIPAPALRRAQQQGYTLTQPSFRLRLIRIPLKGGRTEILITSLLDSDRYPAADFAALYHQRWRIEECFKLLKCRLAVEHFSGELPESIEQDFLAKVWLSNLAATMSGLARLSGELVAETIPNLTYALSALRAALPQLMLRPRAVSKLAAATGRLITKTVEIARPGRSFPRTRQKVKPVKARAYKGLR